MIKAVKRYFENLPDGAKPVLMDLADNIKPKFEDSEEAFTEEEMAKVETSWDEYRVRAKEYMKSTVAIKLFLDLLFGNTALFFILFSIFAIFPTDAFAGELITAASFINVFSLIILAVTFVVFCFGIVYTRNRNRGKQKSELDPVLDRKGIIRALFKTRERGINQKVLDKMRRGISYLINTRIGFINTLISEDKYIRLDIDEIEKNPKLSDWIKEIIGNRKELPFIFYSSARPDFQGKIPEGFLQKILLP